MPDNDDLVYRGVRFSVSRDQLGARVWTVYSDGLPSVSGSTSRRRMSGAFREAIAAAHKVIDALLTQDEAAAD